MKEYVMSVAGMAILTTVVSVLTPEKKYGKVINGVLKLCMLLTLIGPIFQYIGQDTTTFFTSQSILGQDCAYINNSYSLAIKKQLEKQFGIKTQVEVTSFTENENKDSYAGDIQSVKIYISDFGMNEKESHINIITQIVETVEKLSDCNDVEVYDVT